VDVASQQPVSETWADPPAWKKQPDSPKAKLSGGGEMNVQDFDQESSDASVQEVEPAKPLRESQSPFGPANGQDPDEADRPAQAGTSAKEKQVETKPLPPQQQEVAAKMKETRKVFEERQERWQKQSASANADVLPFNDTPSRINNQAWQNDNTQTTPVSHFSPKESQGLAKDPNQVLGFNSSPTKEEQRVSNQTQMQLPGALDDDLPQQAPRTLTKPNNWANSHHFVDEEDEIMMMEIVPLEDV
jgi:hypothetical protein